MITDPLGRSFKKLRVSLTHECNYACIYCTDGGEQQHPPPAAGNGKKLLASADLIEIIRKLHATLQLSAVRLTGGEPLLYPRLRSLVAAVRGMGISSIGMTTNGHLLHGMASDLHQAGLASVNISLDAVSPGTFNKMSRLHGLTNVLKSIDASLDAGLKVKLNTVVVAGQNEGEILPLLRFAMEKKIVIRFLELMPMGPLHHNRQTLFFSRAQILERIGLHYPIMALPKKDGATANEWSIDGQKAFGIIANDSAPFCSDCNRLRLDSYGNIYGCLSSLIPVPVSKNTGEKELISALQLAISHKQTTHFKGNQRTMQSIGG